jgi:monoamine oxidase
VAFRLDPEPARSGRAPKAAVPSLVAAAPRRPPPTRPRPNRSPTDRPARVSRRELLAVGAVGAGALYLGLDRKVFTGRSYRGRVIVVGAGLAGLSAAWELERRGWQTVVLEARPRVGGRCHTLRGFAGGQVAEAGGEYIDTTHRQMRRFAKRFGLRLDDVRHSEDRYEAAAYVEGQLQALGRFAGPEDKAEIERFYERAWRLARQLDPADPAAAGAAYDRRTLASFIDEVGIAGRPRQILDREIRDDYAIEPEKLSLLFFLTETKVSWNTPDSGVEAFRVHGGNDQIARGFASRLEQPPHLGARVTAVRSTAGGVRVTAGGEQFEGDHLILAAALPGLRGVRFDPALPPAVAAAIEELQYGPITKTPLQYGRRFWHQEGWSGETLTDLPLSTSWEATDRQHGRRGILMTYASGDAGLAAASLPTAERVEATADQLSQIYPGSEPLLGRTASIPWSNSPLNGGAYSAFAPGQVTDFWLPLRVSHDRIHLAGEHTARFCGYMEGAVESGLRVARRIDAGED